MQNPAWKEKVSGVWATVLGEPSNFSPVEADCRSSYGEVTWRFIH